MLKRGYLFGKLRLDFLFVYESRRDDIIIESGLHQHEPEPCMGDMIFFTTEFAKQALRTRRDSNRVRVIDF